MLFPSKQTSVAFNFRDTPQTLRDRIRIREERDLGSSIQEGSKLDLLRKELKKMQESEKLQEKEK